jgi:hypothetical protein
VAGESLLPHHDQPIQARRAGEEGRGVRPRRDRETGLRDLVSKPADEA